MARRFRLPGKGGIAPGLDADLTLVRLDQEWELTPANLLDRHKLSPYVGRQFRGQVEQTLLRGQPIFQDGEAATTPHGRLVRPEPRTSPAA